MLIDTQMQHVPYRITSQMQTDMMSGAMPVSFQLLPNVLGNIKAGHPKALAVASTRRLPAIPDVPTSAEVVKWREITTRGGITLERSVSSPHRQIGHRGS